MGQELTVVQTVRQALDKMQPEFRAVLPDHIAPAAFTRVAQTAIQNSPAIQECTPKSIIAACTKLAEIGLQPDGVDAAIIPYDVKVKYRDNDGNERERWEKQAKAMPMVAGIRDLVRRSGQVKNWKVRVVRAADYFEHVDGDEERIVHRPSYDDDSPITHIYSIAYLESGELSRHVITVAHVEKIRKRSRNGNGGPWINDYPEMAQKTCLRQHSKALPKAKDDLQRERFMGALRALDDAEDTLSLGRGQAPAAALPAPALSMHDAARRRLAEAVDLSALDTPDDREHEQATITEKAAPKAPRKRKTADERLAEAEGRAPSGNASAQPAATQAATSTQAQKSTAPSTQSASSATAAQPSDEGRDLVYERDSAQDAQYEDVSDSVDPAEQEGEDGEEVAYRKGWHARFAGKTRVPPKNEIGTAAEAQAWIHGFDAAQKTVDLGNSPKTAEASEAMLDQMVNRVFV